MRGWWFWSDQALVLLTDDSCSSGNKSLRRASTQPAHAGLTQQACPMTAETAGHSPPTWFPILHSTATRDQALSFLCRTPGLRLTRHWRTTPEVTATRWHISTRTGRKSLFFHFVYCIFLLPNTNVNTPDPCPTKPKLPTANYCDDPPEMVMT